MSPAALRSAAIAAAESGAALESRRALPPPAAAAAGDVLEEMGRPNRGEIGELSPPPPWPGRRRPAPPAGGGGEEEVGGEEASEWVLVWCGLVEEWGPACVGRPAPPCRWWWWWEVTEEASLSDSSIEACWVEGVGADRV